MAGFAAMVVGLIFISILYEHDVISYQAAGLGQIAIIVPYIFASSRRWWRRER